MKRGIGTTSGGFPARVADFEGEFRKPPQSAQAKTLATNFTVLNDRPRELPENQ